MSNVIWDQATEWQVRVVLPIVHIKTMAVIAVLMVLSELVKMGRAWFAPPLAAPADQIIQLNVARI